MSPSTRVTCLAAIWSARSLNGPHRIPRDGSSLLRIGRAERSGSPPPISRSTARPVPLFHREPPPARASDVEDRRGPHRVKAMAVVKSSGVGGGEKPDLIQFEQSLRRYPGPRSARPRMPAPAEATRQAMFRSAPSRWPPEPNPRKLTANSIHAYLHRPVTFLPARSAAAESSPEGPHQRDPITTPTPCETAAYPRVAGAATRPTEPGKKFR